MLGLQAPAESVSAEDGRLALPLGNAATSATTVEFSGATAGRVTLAKPRALALTGRKADGWAAPPMNYMPPADAAEAHEAIDRAAVEAGRDPRCDPAHSSCSDPRIPRCYGHSSRTLRRTFVSALPSRAHAEPVAATAADAS